MDGLRIACTWKIILYAWRRWWMVHQRYERAWWTWIRAQHARWHVSCILKKSWLKPLMYDGTLALIETFDAEHDDEEAHIINNKDMELANGTNDENKQMKLQTCKVNSIGYT